MITDKEIEERKKLLGEISPWPWKTDPIGYESYVWSKEQNMVADTVIRMRGVGSDQPISKNYEFVTTAPAFEDALIKRVRELEKSLSDMPTGMVVVEKIHELSIARDRVEELEKEVLNLCEYSDMALKYECRNKELEAENKQLTAKVNARNLTKEESELMDKALFDSVEVLPTPPKDGKE